MYRCYCNEKHCPLNLERLLVKFRPFNLPREFTLVLVAAVYVYLRANANEAMDKLHKSKCKHQDNHPEGFFIVAEGFYHTNLKIVLPRFYKNVDFKTRMEKTLGIHQHLEPINPILPIIFLKVTRGTHTPPISRSKPQYVTKQYWTEETTQSLQDCF